LRSSCGCPCGRLVRERLTHGLRAMIGSTGYEPEAPASGSRRRPLAVRSPGGRGSVRAGIRKRLGRTLTLPNSGFHLYDADLRRDRPVPKTTFPACDRAAVAAELAGPFDRPGIRNEACQHLSPASASLRPLSAPDIGQLEDLRRGTGDPRHDPAEVKREIERGRRQVRQIAILVQVMAQVGDQHDRELTTTS
jgi:hypothetical protein